MNQTSTLTRFLAKAGYTPLECLIVMLIAIVGAVITGVCISDISVYRAENTAKRAALHTAILKNQPPGGRSWEEAGANNLNVRFTMVWIAEQLSEMTGNSTDFIYRAIDLTALFVALLSIHVLLKHWYLPVEAILGLLLFCLLLPCTALNYYFHPWDRPMLFLWAVMILALVNNRVILFALLYAISILMKFDSVVAAGMIFLLFARTDNWRRPAGTTLIVGALGIMIWSALLVTFPGGQEPIDVFQQMAGNFSQAITIGIDYPPLLVHGLLLALGIAGWKSAPIIMRRLAMFGLLLLIPHFLFTNFVEVRAQIGTMLCLLPLALWGVLSISESAGQWPTRVNGDV
jgi:hypothetical protein